jgi:hypothetical protein
LAAIRIRHAIFTVQNSNPDKLARERILRIEVRLECQSVVDEGCGVTAGVALGAYGSYCVDTRLNGGLRESIRGRTCKPGECDDSDDEDRRNVILPGVVCANPRLNHAIIDGLPIVGLFPTAAYASAISGLSTFAPRLSTMATPTPRLALKSNRQAQGRA